MRAVALSEYGHRVQFAADGCILIVDVGELVYHAPEAVR
jgi:hypothetical protein